MTADETRRVILETVTRIAPEIDPDSIRAGVNFREELDLDSMDFLNFVLALHDRLGIDIPEIDYPRLYTLGGAVTYLVSKLDGGRGTHQAPIQEAPVRILSSGGRKIPPVR